MENKLKKYKEKINNANLLTSKTDYIADNNLLLKLTREQAEKAIELGIKIGFSETELSDNGVGKGFNYHSINNIKDLNRFYEVYAKEGSGFLNYLTIDPCYNEIDKILSHLEFVKIINDVMDMEKEKSKYIVEVKIDNRIYREQYDSYQLAEYVVKRDNMDPVKNEVKIIKVDDYKSFKEEQIKKSSSNNVTKNKHYHKRFTEEQIQKANDVSIVDYARQKGYSIKDINEKTAKIEGHGGLFINKYTNRWYCFADMMGGGVVQFATLVLGLKWVDAIKDLIGEEGELQYKQHQNINHNEVEQQSKDFTPPEKNTTYKHIFAYLIKTRRIDKDIVSNFVKDKLIYENDKGSCVFIGKDKDNITRYASIRSTSTAKEAFRGEASGSDKRFGFSRMGNCDKLVIFESPIDMLSYMSIYKMAGMEDKIKDYHLLSLGGVSDVALKQYLQDHPEIKHIMSALDNDQAGNKASEEIAQKYGQDYKVNRLNITDGNDLNEVLINKQNEIELQEKVSNQVQDYQMEA